MGQTSTPAYQGLMGAFGQKKKKPDLQAGAPPAVNPYAQFANYSQNQPAQAGLKPPPPPPPAQPAGTEQESALKKFRAKHGL